MRDLIAKPIVNDQYWIITDGNKKVGNIEANNAGYGLQLNGTFLQFNNTDEIKDKTKIRFEPIKSDKSKINIPYLEYPSPKKTYNDVFDVVRGIHLFTKTKKSKCQHAAGYFIIEQNNGPNIVFCPKYIFIQRYRYKGPFKTLEEAKNQINTV